LKQQVTLKGENKMMISDLNYLEVIFDETSIIGGAAYAFAQARAIARGTNSAVTRTSASTQTISRPGYNFAASDSRSEAYAN